MSKTFHLTVTVTVDTEKDYEQLIEHLAEIGVSHGGAVSGPQWDSVPEDEE